MTNKKAVNPYANGEFIIRLNTTVYRHNFGNSTQIQIVACMGPFLEPQWYLAVPKLKNWKRTIGSFIDITNRASLKCIKLKYNPHKFYLIYLPLLKQYAVYV